MKLSIVRFLYHQVSAAVAESIEDQLPETSLSRELGKGGVNILSGALAGNPLGGNHLKKGGVATVRKGKVGLQAPKLKERKEPPRVGQGSLNPQWNQDSSSEYAAELSSGRWQAGFTVPPRTVTLTPHTRTVTLTPHTRTVILTPHTRTVTLTPHTRTVTLTPHTRTVILRLTLAL